MRRVPLAMVLVLTALVVLPLQAKDLTKITLVQSSLSFNFVPLFIAQTAGYFQDEGIQLDVVLAGGGPKAMTGLVGGGGQFSASVLFDGVMAHRRGRRARARDAVTVPGTDGRAQRDREAARPQPEHAV